jgi:hypothetical protein
VKYQYSKHKNCKICGVEICNVSTHCKKCSNLIKAKHGEEVHQYVDGNYSKPHYCIDCGKELHSHNRDVKRCLACNGKLRRKPYYCVDCGKQITKGCKYCKPCWAKHNTGENNPAYIDGRKSKKYNGEFTDKLKQLIKIRDNFKCQACGVEENQLVLFHVHHIDMNKHNNHPKNLILLCHSCHMTVHGLIKMKNTGDK